MSNKKYFRVQKLFVHSFDTLYFSDNDMAASLQMTTLWSNFIKTGDPGPAWSPVTSDDKRFLNLGLEKHMQERDDYYLQRMEFWRSL